MTKATLLFCLCCKNWTVWSCDLRGSDYNGVTPRTLKVKQNITCSLQHVTAMTRGQRHSGRRQSAAAVLFTSHWPRWLWSDQYGGGARAGLHLVVSSKLHHLIQECSHANIYTPQCQQLNVSGIKQLHLFLFYIPAAEVVFLYVEDAFIRKAEYFWHILWLFY